MKALSPKFSTNLRLIVFAISLISCFSLQAQNNAFKRARALGKGMNIQYLEEYWNGSASQRYRNYLNISTLPQWKNHIANIPNNGFNSIRVPICFDVWTSQTQPYSLYDSPSYFAAVDSIVKWSTAQNLMVIIDYHHGQLFDGTMNTELPRIKTLWTEIAERYKNTDPDKVLFEAYNEPNGISAANWQTAASQITATIRAIAPNHSIVLGATEWNGVYALANNTLSKLSDPNIIYTFHFYDPFIFTHQGASWVGNPVATTGIPYPYNAANMPTINPLAVGTWGQSALNGYANSGNKNALQTPLQAAKNWATTQNVPVFVGEFGAYGAFADQTSRCNLVVDDIDLFGNMGFSWAQWEWDKGFSMIQGPASEGQINPCMKTAMDAYEAKFSFNFKGKLYLEGLLNGSLMRTDLRTKNLIPLQQPFNVAPWNYMGTEAVVNIPTDVSD
jgi:endoglucanase